MYIIDYSIFNGLKHMLHYIIALKFPNIYLYIYILLRIAQKNINHHQVGVPVVFVFLGVKGEDFLEKSVGQKGAPGSPPPHHFEVPIVCGVLER